jgi:hypothetical protein
MKETGIIFSTPLIPKLLDDSKTQTRRLKGLKVINANPDEWECEGYVTHTDGLWRFKNKRDNSLLIIKCPYGQTQDVLWVKETSLIDGWYDGDDKDLPLVKRLDNQGKEHTILYKADYPDLRAIDDDGEQKWRKDGSEASVKWRTSMFMYRWASRKV